MQADIRDLIDAIYKKYKPISVFLYGSRARGDFLKTSDFEIGIIFPREKRVSRTALKNSLKLKNVVIYSFAIEDFLSHKIDIPFPKNIYYRDLKLSGKTLAGQKIIEKLKAPIRILDLLERINFDLGVAFSAALSYRQKDFVNARANFVKSCLFGIRNLIILKRKIFPLTCREIYENSKKLDLDDEYNQVLKQAMRLRRGGKIKEKNIYKNISLLNLIVKEKILKEYKKHGNKILLK